MPQLDAEVSAELLQLIDTAAAHFNQNREEIVRRAVTHYLEHVEEVQAVLAAREAGPGAPTDWGAVKNVLQKSHCAFDNCPFIGDCWVDLCPL
jgi:hypothetical protein